ncbi:MAG: ATP-binding protein [Desulfobacterales bacterium]|nr:ATP-binding protein [Desulfobacterales bacterium]
MLSYIKQRVSLKYILVTSVTIAFVFTLLYFWISHQEKQLIMEQVKKQAVILHKQIVLTREWVSDRNYLLVKKQKDRPVTSFLRHAEIKDDQGGIYVKITPSMLTRQLSDYAMRSNLYSFNLTNLHTMNPGNRPDDFEADALLRFISGQANEASRIETHAGKKVYRYAAPLPIKQSCLNCHKDMKEKTGGVGGCISVFIPIEQVQKSINKNNLILFLTMTSLTGSVIVILFFFTNRLIFSPVKKIRKLTQRIRVEEFEDGSVELQGDELNEFGNICHVIDKKLKNRHHELERKIQEATEDLYATTLNLKQANEELTALNTAKTEFFSDISHELRTPLTSIKGAADILTRKSSCSDPIYLDIIKKNTDHLIRTILDFLDYSRIEAGRLELDYTHESLTEIIQEVIDARTAEAVERQLTIDFNAQENFEARVDRYRIYQVVSNLMANAIKFSHEKGLISVTIEAIGNELTVYLADEGIGIDPEYHQVIFKKFQQVPRANGQPDFQKGSSGIGLAICRGIVKAHGGNIRVESLKGEGSTFIFTLPRS